MSVYSGSTYEGETRDGWYHGKGEYTYPSGVKYKGNFHKGQFHGEGVLIYQNGGQYKGIWNLGKKVSGDYFFFDDLKYEDDNWDYCIGEDRRFNFERINGIKPAGQTMMTNNPEGENIIPPGTYDTGDGYFDPIRTLVYSYDGTKLLRTPEQYEVDWITKTCRYEPRTTQVPLTGDQDEVIQRVMELQVEGRRDIAEELMKGGVREPDRYIIKEVPVVEVKPEDVKDQTDVHKNANSSSSPNRDNQEAMKGRKSTVKETQEGENGHEENNKKTEDGYVKEVDGDQEEQSEYNPKVAQEESLDSDESDD